MNQERKEAPFGQPGTVYVLVIGGRAGAHEFPLVNPVATVGRSDEADVMIAEALASRLHAQFEITAAGVKVIDLESRNGTKLNGKPVNQAMLKAGDIVGIGETTIRVVSRYPTNGPAQPHHPAPAVAQTPARSPETAAELIWIADGAERRFRVLRDVVTIGRSEKATLTIAEPLASREHARVLYRAEDGTYDLEDLGSRNGTSLNNREVRGIIQLMPGDRITIGHSDIVFSLPGAAPAMGMQPGQQVAMPGPRAMPPAGMPLQGGPMMQRQAPVPLEARRRRAPVASRSGDSTGVIAVVVIIVLIVIAGAAYMIAQRSGSSTTQNQPTVNSHRPPPPPTIQRPTPRDPAPATNTERQAQQEPEDSPPPGYVRSNWEGEEVEIWARESGLSDREHRGRQAWVDAYKDVEEAMLLPSYGAAYQRIQRFLAESGFDSDEAVARAEARKSEILRQARAAWENDWKPQLQIATAEERQAMASRVRAHFEGLEEIMLEARPLIGS